MLASSGFFYARFYLEENTPMIPSRGYSWNINSVRILPQGGAISLSHVAEDLGKVQRDGGGCF